MPDHSQDTVVITDTSCFIILDKIKATYLLNELFTKVITTPEVAVEYGSPLPDWVDIQQVKNITLQNELALIIDAGEASAIALASEIYCDYLLTDDLAARKFAELRGFRVKGSAGLLLYAKQQGVIQFIRAHFLN